MSDLAIPASTSTPTTQTTVALYLAFAATGVGVALPGVLLPALMQQWNLHDSQAGLLFLCAWFGSSIGALLVQGPLRITLACGGVLVAIGCFGLATFSGRHFPWLMTCYGLGLGLTMTSISLLRQRHAANTEVEMVRLNLLWAVGACAYPSLAIRALRSGNTHPLLVGMGTLFATLAIWSLASLSANRKPKKDDREETLPNGEKAHPRLGSVLALVPLPLLLMLFFSTGIEASFGGWLTTYAQRAHDNFALTIAAPTCLWAGLLCSRALWSIPGMRFRASRVVQASLCALSVSALLLIVGGGGVWVLIAAFGIGFSLGPVYPLLLAQALSYRQTGTLFFVAGLGSAALPWLTGVTSQTRSSLRQALLIPTVAALLMLLLSARMPFSQNPRPHE